MTLAWILVASVAGGTLSAGLAAVALLLRATWIPMLVSFAIGALLGAAFLEIIPHAFETGEAHKVAFSILGGIFGFFVLEKLLLYRHCHTENCEVHDQHASSHDHGRSGTLIVVGDTVHNFVDGVLIAAAFVQSTELGVVTAVAIIAHEIPQEVGDYIVLLNAGFSRPKALLFNALSGLAAVAGGVLGYFVVGPWEDLFPYLLVAASSSFIYVAVADLLPQMQRRLPWRETALQLAWLVCGLSVVMFTMRLLHSH